MSARKWPFYTLEVGESFVLKSMPYWLPRKMYEYGHESGKKFSYRRVDRERADSPIMITRLK